MYTRVSPTDGGGSTTPVVVGGGDNGGTPVGECDPANYGPAGLGADADDCSKFYQCTTGGILYSFNCPPNQYFNPTLYVCDWSSAVCGGANGGCKCYSALLKYFA